MDNPNSKYFNTLDLLLKYIPYLGAIIYFFGFIIFNSYLSSYRIFDFKLLSPEYLRAGILFWIVNTPIIGIILFIIKIPTDDLKKDNGQVLRSFLLTSVYIVLISQRLFDKAHIWTSNVGLIILLLYSSSIFIGTSWFARNWPGWIMKALTVLPFLSYFFYISFKGYTEQVVFVFGLLVLFVISLNLYIDFCEKKLNPFIIALYLLTLISVAVAFGVSPIRAIDSTLGGLKINKKCLLFSDDSKKILQNTPLRDSIINNQTKPLNIVYQTDQAYFIKLSDSLTLNINKLLFVGEITFKQ